MILSYTVNMDIKVTVGKNLRDARKAKKLTQKEVAVHLQKYQPDYSQYETGKIELDYRRSGEECQCAARLFSQMKRDRPAGRPLPIESV